MFDIDKSSWHAVTDFLFFVDAATSTPTGHFGAELVTSCISDGSLKLKINVLASNHIHFF